MNTANNTPHHLRSITVNETQNATSFDAAKLLLEVRLGQATASRAIIEVLEKEAESILDPDGGITKSAYAHATPELISLAREDRRRRIKAKLIAGEASEYVFRGLPEQTDWRELLAWIKGCGLNPLSVVVPRGGDYAYVIFPVRESAKVEDLFPSSSDLRFKEVKLNVRKARRS